MRQALTKAGVVFIDEGHRVGPGVGMQKAPGLALLKLQRAQDPKNFSPQCATFDPQCGCYPLQPAD
jgi:hypothetical protein